MVTDFELTGFEPVPKALCTEMTDRLLEAFTRFEGRSTAVSERAGSVYGMRNLLNEMPAVREVVCSDRIRRTVRSILGDSAFAVRALFFDKTPKANWSLSWHQDRMIPILDRRTVPGFWPWSDKGGVAHVQPPAAILERMVAFRLHLDDCPAESGPLRVIPGSHRLGILSDEGIARARETMAEQTITAEKGDGLLMRPLLLHASSAVAGPAEHRRVLHIEWAVDDLPGGLEWHSRV